MKMKALSSRMQKRQRAVSFPDSGVCSKSDSVQIPTKDNEWTRLCWIAASIKRTACLASCRQRRQWLNFGTGIIAIQTCSHSLATTRNDEITLLKPVRLRLIFGHERTNGRWRHSWWADWGQHNNCGWDSLLTTTRPEVKFNPIKMDSYAGNYLGWPPPTMPIAKMVNFYHKV